MARFVLDNREETLRWGAALGAHLQPGDVVALVGDLGVGKTTLTQAISRGLGVTVPVTSPTFTLIHEYPGRIPLFHFDPYRLERPEDAADLGLEEYFERGGVVVVEWADKVLALLPPERLTLTLEIVGDGTPEALDEDAPRRVRVEATGERYRALVQELASLPEWQARREREGAAP